MKPRFRVMYIIKNSNMKKGTSWIGLRAYDKQEQRMVEVSLKEIPPTMEFDNFRVKRVERGVEYEGIGCSLSRMPKYDTATNQVENLVSYYVDRILKDEQGETVGYVMQTIQGVLYPLKVEQLGKLKGVNLVNAKLVEKGNTMYLQGLKGSLPVEVLKERKEERVGEDRLEQRHKELHKELKEAARVYYSGTDEIMSNFEYDKKYDELEKIEKMRGIKYPGSVTEEVGYEVQSKLPKIKHQEKMLSLDKTKSVEELKAFLGDNEGIISWKLDGITNVATYEDGKLTQAVTRGNGVVGEDITKNYQQFKNTPKEIRTKDKVVVRGEGLISYKTFERINEGITGEKYKNPRNLASGSIRQLDTRVTAERGVLFVAFNVVEGYEEIPTLSGRLDKLREDGFETVEYWRVNKDNIEKAVKEIEKVIDQYPYPTDGLVLVIDDIEKGKALGSTSKHPRNAIAFKWKDETAETVLRDIDWSVSRTGTITPVAIFDPVELEGTTVTRASLHNLSIVQGLELGLGDTIEVMKANMIIPQVVDNITRSRNLEVPRECPVCGGETKIQVTIDKSTKRETAVLVCTNPDCLSKHIGLLVHFTGRDAANIDGLSEATLEKFVAEGYIHKLQDIYKLEEHRDKIVKMPGFGVRSYEKIIKAVEKSREIELPNFLYALGINQLGRSTSRIIADTFKDDLEKILNVQESELRGIEGIGDIIAKEIVEGFNKPGAKEEIMELSKEFKIQDREIVDKEALAQDSSNEVVGKTFVVTGSVNHFKNRKELQAAIEAKGGKVSGSVSKNTDYLVNNDIESTSSKNKKAKELGKPIITEEEIMRMLG